MHSGTANRSKLFSLVAALFVVTCLLPAIHAQSTGSHAGESILQQRYEAAQRYQADHELERAAEQYRIFVADALGEVAIGRAQADQYDKAQDDFDEALRLVPNFPMMQLEYARAALHANHLEHAVLLAKALVQNYPGNTKVVTGARNVLGRAYLNLGKNGEAKLQFEAAVLLDPTFENGYQLGVADLDLGDAAGARKVFAEMLATFGDTAALHMSFGQAYLNSDFQVDAVAEFQKALAKDPHLRGIHYSLAVAYLATAGDSKISAAEAELREEIASSPKDASSYAALGHLIATHGRGPADRAEAEANLKRAGALDPANPDSFFYLGQFYADQKRIPEAESALRQSIALTGDVSRNAFQVQKAHYILARLLAQADDRVEADKEFAASQSLLKQSLSRDQGRLSKYLGERGRSDIATEFAQPIGDLSTDPPDGLKSRVAVEAFEARMTPAIADSYNNLGAIAAGTEHYDAAVTYFQRAAEWAPNIPGLDFNWGRAAFAAGAYAQAIGPLSRYIRIHPEEEGARRVLGLSQFMIKDYSSARATLVDLASHPSEPAKVQLAYAVSLLKTGDASAALPLLEILYKSRPDLAEIMPALEEAKAAVARSH